MNNNTYTIMIFITLLFMCVYKNAQAVRIYSNDGKFLGNVNTNQFDKDSVNNPFGKYGSPFSPDSIKNPFSKYGSPFGTDSVNRPNLPQTLPGLPKY